MSAFLLSFVLSVSVAQQPPSLPPISTDLLAPVAPAADSAEIAYALADATLLRWPDAEGSSGTLKKGDRLTVVLRRPDGLVRVAHGGDFGWVQAALLSAEAVAADEPPADAAAP